MRVIAPAAAVRISVIAMTGVGFLLAGRYRLQERIASGGAGVVWRAADEVLRRRVAVKVLQSAFAGEPEARARFRDEARNASSLSHPAVARVYDYGEDASLDVPFLVMELVDGPSVAEVLAAGPLDPGRTMDLIAQAAAGLQAAHSAGVVHRDIKPANLLISREGQVKITDFGIASATWSEPVTRSGTLVGTAAYIAPERVTGASATPQSDLYSLGIVARECLAGVPPFRGSAVDVAEAHLQGRFPPLPADVPADVAGLVAALTARDPENRPGSAREVSESAARLHAAAGVAPSGGAWPDLMAARRPAADCITLTDLSESASPPAGGPALDQGLEPNSRRYRRMRRPLRTVVAMAAALAAVGLGGWQIGMSSAARPQAEVVRTPPQPSRIMVNSQNLVGQPVAVVLGDLRALGLQPRLAWVTNGARAPGTVVSVQPGGSVPAGSIVVVTAAAQPIRQPSQNGISGGNTGDGGDGGRGGSGGDGGSGGLGSGSDGGGGGGH